MQLTTYEFHPAANLFPMMSAQEFAELKADIKQHGVREHIVIFDGRLLDGRNRYKAMLELGIDPEREACELEVCEDPIAWVLSHNLHRRHLTTSQRAAIAAEVAKLRRGDIGNGRKVGPQNCGSTASDAAKVLGVSERSVETAKHVSANGDQAVVDMVKQGDLPVSLAAKLVDAVPDKSKQEEIVRQGKQAVREAVKRHHREDELLDSDGKTILTGDFRVESSHPDAAVTCPNCGGHNREEDNEGAYCLDCIEPLPVSSDSTQFALLVNALDEANRQLREASRILKQLPDAGPGRSHAPKLRSAVGRALVAGEDANMRLSRWVDCRQRNTGGL